MEKYLRHYAEPETAVLEALPGQHQWANVMVIPACNESSGFLRPPPSCDGRSLMILVINESIAATDAVSSRNRALAAKVRAKYETQWNSGPEFGISLLRDPTALHDVLLVDRFSDGRQLPAKGGVGHARKIGADLAAGLIHLGRVHSPWIHCTDADVHLPKAYFTCSNEVQGAEPSLAALIYPFHHGDYQGETENQKVILATQLYELSLRYYVAGLKTASSPYAFHTIGSTMAISAAHYAKVRGFPRREAGEDFYLLNKLAKLGAVKQLDADSDCEPILIDARCSDRVPFGTGAAVTRISTMVDPMKEFCFYDPAVFELLRQWLQAIPAVWQSRSAILTTGILPDATGDHDQTTARQSLLDCLKEIGLQRALEHAFRQSKDPDQFTRQIHIWFDAFRTLKLIHALRNHHLPSISYEMLEANQTFHQLMAQDSDLFACHEQLRRKLSTAGVNAL